MLLALSKTDASVIKFCAVAVVVAIYIWRDRD